MLCEMVSERALFAGAVNTLKRTGAGWYGDNTDGEGLARDLARLGYAVEGQRVLILGAGGAVRGMLAPLLALKPADRSEEHTSELQSLMRISYAVFCLKKKKTTTTTDRTLQCRE